VRKAKLIYFRSYHHPLTEKLGDWSLYHFVSLWILDKPEILDLAFFDIVWLLILEGDLY
jgi:hypothetical protein